MLESGAMSINGHGHLQQIVDAPRPLRAAELSSQQRNALVDELVATVNANARALAELRTRLELQRTIIDEVQTVCLFLDAQLTEFQARSLWQRVRWLVLGR